MKLVYDDNISRKWYDVNLKDAFGRKFLVVVDDIGNWVRLIAKNKEYKKRRKQLDDMGCKNVVIPEWIEVIDITSDTLNKIKMLFPNYCYGNWQIHDI